MPKAKFRVEGCFIVSVFGITKRCHTQTLQQAVHLSLSLLEGSVCSRVGKTRCVLPHFQSSGLFSMYSHSQLAFFVLLISADVFFRTEITVA